MRPAKQNGWLSDWVSLCADGQPWDQTLHTAQIRHGLLEGIVCACWLKLVNHLGKDLTEEQ